MCDHDQSEVGFCRMLVILFQFFRQPYLHGFYIKTFFTLVPALFAHNEIMYEMKISWYM